jgi:hypothetical protein
MSAIGMVLGVPALGGGGVLDNAIRALAPTMYWPTDDPVAVITNAMAASVSAVSLTNADFATWSGDNPTGYSVVGESAGVREVTQRATNQGYTDTPAGTGAACFFRNTATTALVCLQANKITIGKTYQIAVVVSKYVSGTVALYDGSGGNDGQWTAAGTLETNPFIADGDDPGILGSGAACDFTVDSWSINKVGEVDGRAANITLQQTGPERKANALDFNGSSSTLAFIDTAVNGLAEFSFWFGVKLDSIANGDILLAKTDEITLVLNTGGTLTATVHYDGGTDGACTTTTTLTAGTWYGITLSINNTSKTPRLWINATEATYNGTPTPGVGSRVSNTNALYFGDPAGSVSFDGLLSVGFIRTTELTAGEVGTLARFLA